MTHKILVFEQKKCIGCRLCEAWCSISHFGVNNPARSRIRIVRNHDIQMDCAIMCHQCTDAPCIAACKKFKALDRDPDTNAIRVIRDNCVGCRLCIRACPYGAPSLLPDEKKIIICDLCGGDPECVKHCPEQAIQYLPPEMAERPYRGVLVTEKMQGGHDE